MLYIDPALLRRQARQSATMLRVPAPPQWVSPLRWRLTTTITMHPISAPVNQTAFLATAVPSGAGVNISRCISCLRHGGVPAGLFRACQPLSVCWTGSHPCSPHCWETALTQPESTLGLHRIHCQSHHRNSRRWAICIQWALRARRSGWSNWSCWHHRALQVHRSRRPKHRS